MGQGVSGTPAFCIVLQRDFLPNARHSNMRRDSGYYQRPSPILEYSIIP